MIRLLFLIIVFLNVICCRNTKVEEQDTLNSEDSIINENIKGGKFKLDDCLVLKSKGEFKYEDRGKGFSDIYGLKLTCTEGDFYVDFFGPSPEGEHGMHYFKSDMKKFELIDSVSFEVVLEKGTLYNDFISFESLESISLTESSGFDNTELKLTGHFLSGDSLRVNCVGQNDFDCFGTGKIFIKQ